MREAALEFLQQGTADRSQKPEATSQKAEASSRKPEMPEKSPNKTELRVPNPESRTGSEQSSIGDHQSAIPWLHLQWRVERLIGVFLCSETYPAFQAAERCNRQVEEAFRALERALKDALPPLGASSER